MASRYGGHRVDGWGVAWPAPYPSRVSVSILRTAVRYVAGMWLELCLLIIAGAGLARASAAGVLWLGVAAMTTLTAAAIGLRPCRLVLRQVLHARRVRRAWSRAIRVAAIGPYTGRVPSVERVRVVPAGDVLDVRIPVGGTVDALAASSEALAVALQLRAVTVERNQDNAARARVTLVRRDPLTKPAPPWPQRSETQLSLWEPIPVGIDDAGDTVQVVLPERNMLLGGEPGAGKSNALSLLVAAAAMDPNVRLHLFDGKLVELATWAGCADHNVGISTGQANDVLRELRVEMDDRYLSLLANRVRKVTPELGLQLHLLVIDELAHYLLAADRKERTDFAELLRDVVARGRAAGLIVLAATQKPSHEVIPTALRDLFGFRWALRCSTHQASDTVLGGGWASLGYSAAHVDAAHRGVGYLLHEGGRPIRLRSHQLDDGELIAIASRAEGLRNVGGRGRE